MKVSIDHGETKKGLIFTTKFYTVTVHVTFSAEEQAIIRERKLGKDIVLKREPPVNAKVTQVTGVMSAGKVLSGLGKTQNGFHLKISDLLNGADTYTLSTPVEAKEYEHELLGCLKNLKGYLVENAEGGTNKTLEF